MSPLPLDVRASYVVIIDGILAKSDLQTVTSKRIREGLQSAVDYDITPEKNEIKALIMERFDKFAAERNAIPEAIHENNINHNHEPQPDHDDNVQRDQELYMDADTIVAEPRAGSKRKSESEKEEQSPEIPTTSPPPKKKRKADIDEDAAFAARLQAELNSRDRPTRGGTVRKPPVVKKKKKSIKKKTSPKVKADDDSDIGNSDSAAEKKVNRSGGFHKPLTLSAPLSALMDGETQMSRPQTVKRIWAYVKERNLQDPKDKRLIRCDESLRAVFKSDKVHMFTMNKILSTQMYDPDA